MEDTAQRLTDAGQSGVCINDKLTQHTAREHNRNCLILIFHRREMRGFLGILCHLNCTLKIKETTSPLPSNRESIATLASFGAS